MPKKGLVSHIQMAVAMMLAGSSVVAAKLLCARLPVFLSQGMSLMLAFLVLLLFRRNRKQKEIWTVKNAVMVGFQALLGTFGFRICLQYGMRFIPASVGGIILGSTPAMMALLSYIILRERPSANRWMGIALSFVAVMCLQTFTTRVEGGVFLGGGLLLLAVFGEAMMTILRKQMTPGVSALTNVTAVAGAALAMFLPISVAEAFRYDWSLFGWAEAGLVAYYGIIATALAYLLWFSGIEDTPGHVAAVFMGITPVSSVLLAACFGEQLRPVHGLATLLLLLGIWIMARYRGVKIRTMEESNPQCDGQKASA
jgi:drug/metabolite transporter (DMT)-like permease